MRRLRGRMGTTGAITGALVLAAVFAPNAAGAATSYHGCPSGNVCIYPGTGYNGDQPSNTYYDYGCYKLYDQLGNHRVVNNQTGKAGMLAYSSSNCGTGYLGWLGPGGNDVINLTPINSIELVAS